MYVYLGAGTVVRDEDIVGIFDLDITSQSHRTRQYLKLAEQAGQVETAAEDLPKSFVLCQRQGEGTQRVILAQPNPATLANRANRNSSQ